MDKLEAAIQVYLALLNSIIETYNTCLGYEGTLSEQDAIRIITRSQNLVHKVAEKDSSYAKEIDIVASECWSTSYKAEVMIGILLGIRDELTIGDLISAPELIRGELFENFLEMVEYLANEGYKDAAAVITGSSLEAHLRRLAQKHGIEIKIVESGIKTRYKKAETINQDLYKAKIYSPFDQKQITAWLDLRNSAAHGNYTNYGNNQVLQFIEWAKDFISKNRA